MNQLSNLIWKKFIEDCINGIPPDYIKSMDNFDEINLFNLDNKLNGYRIINLKKLDDHKTQESRFNMYFNELKPNNKGKWKHKAIYLRYLKVAYNYFNELEKNNLFIALKDILYSKFLGQQYLTIAYEKERFIATRKPNVIIVDLYNTQL